MTFDPSDTVIGFNGKGPLGMGGTSITIGDIYVSGVSGNPEEIANEIAKTLRRELRTQ